MPKKSSVPELQENSAPQKNKFFSAMGKAANPQVQKEQNVGNPKDITSKKKLNGKASKQAKAKKTTQAKWRSSGRALSLYALIIRASTSMQHLLHGGERGWERSGL
jgi:hypothetical protein